VEVFDPELTPTNNGMGHEGEDESADMRKDVVSDGESELPTAGGPPENNFPVSDD